MADVVHAAPPDQSYLGRLHMRFAGVARAHEDPATDFEARRRITDARLSGAIKNRDYIRVKYKGNRAIVPPVATTAEERAVAKREGRKLTGHTSGIPIFGNEDAGDRAGWSLGHVAMRNKLTAQLLEGLGAADKKGVSAENSHALGHGDYGMDHLLSAPAASKAQNTEQLAIELGMRAAAQKLNPDDSEHSLVHAKITDVLHPKTGHLVARRFKLIRKSDADDKVGRVVFDHIMDGTRTHISKEEAFDLGGRVHDALMTDPAAQAAAAKSTTRVDALHAESGQYGMGGAVAPAPSTRTQLATRQSDALKALQERRHLMRAVFRKPVGPVPDRHDVDLTSPAMTDVHFPRDADCDLPASKLAGHAAVEEARLRVFAHNHELESDDMLSSGSLPASEEVKLMRAMKALKNKFGGPLGEAASDNEDMTNEHVYNAVNAVGPRGAYGAQDFKAELVAHHQAVEAAANAVHAAGKQPSDFLDDDDRFLLRTSQKYSLHHVTLR